ncbi:MAG: AAA family ATPase [Actinomycetota bacterium]|nr:AAA family ATPase [Actinomycetota bacterium]
MAAPVAEERKVVTVLFVDLTGSTELSARLDPERFREVMAAFYHEVVEEVESLRGRAENFAGDAVLGVFGVPQAHDNDALRAVRASIDIRERVAALGERLQLPFPLRVRIGVNTGAVAVVADPAVRSVVLGAAVNLAARLQQAAEPGEILVGETTRHLTRDTVEYGPRRDVVAKGFEGNVRAWPVIGLSARSGRRTIPLVNRKRELALLSDTFDRVIETSRAHLVTLFGEPGIGKSRLADEFRGALPSGTKVLIGRASALEEDETFAPLAEMVRRELGVESDIPPEQLHAKLEDAVNGCCEPTESEQIVARLGMALGLGADTGEEWKYRVAEVRSGLVGFVAGLARREPVVMIFEDLHLAQTAFLELVEQAVRESRRVPLMVLCVARWDLLEARPDWSGGIPDALTLYLEPLSSKHAVALALEAGEGLDPETADLVASHAGGNPFFIVETTGMLRHEDQEAPPGTVRETLSGRLLPPTVQAVVASRIDHLPPDARTLVRRASVFPRSSFHVTELERVTDAREEVLATLEDEELFVREEDRPGVWRFRHGLLRDVAYDSLSKRERRDLHLRVAESLAGEDPDRYPRSIAYHLEQAAKASLDLAPNDRTLADRAVAALAAAGDLARRGIESRAAVDLYERALALAGPERSWGLREARILTGIGEARYWLGEFEGAAAALAKALELGIEDIRIRAHASRFLADISLTVQGDRDGATKLFDQALEAAQDLGDPWTLARTLLQAGWVPYWRGDLPSARVMFEEALVVARQNPDGDPWAEARALSTLATIVASVSPEQESLGMAREALAIGERMGDPFTVAVAKENVANSLRRMWRLDEALPVIDQSVAGFRELDARWELASALISRGMVERLSDAIEASERDLREALRLCRELKERSISVWGTSELVKTLLVRGEVGEARLILQQVTAEAADRQFLESPVWAETLVILAEGRADEAAALAAEILASERARGWPNEVAAQTWSIGTLFAPELVGGEDVMKAAHDRLEQVGWIQAIREPELMMEKAAWSSA